VRLLATALALLLTLAGCASPQPPTDACQAAALPCTPSLAFLGAGHTQRAEAVARLGEPSSRWESGRILVWPVVRDARGGLHVAWSGPGRPLPRSHDLVLVFDAAGRLERHALVPRDEP
jgi:hypothetical protein